MAICEERLLSVSRAQNWPEFLKALARYKVPSENMVYADRAGNIGWRASDMDTRRARTSARELGRPAGAQPACGRGPALRVRALWHCSSPGGLSWTRVNATGMTLVAHLVGL